MRKSALVVLIFAQSINRQKNLPTSIEINVWVIPKALEVDLDIHLVQTLVAWLTSEEWGFTEVQLRIRNSFERHHQVASAAGLQTTGATLGADESKEAWFVNNISLFSGPSGRTAAARKGCKSHAECKSTAKFCEAIDEEFKNKCAPCSVFQEESSIDGLVPDTPECKKSAEENRQSQGEEGEEGEEG